jgi:hypothetical protein
MDGEFFDDIVEKAWKRSRGHCECKRTTHGHVGRCSRFLVKSLRGDRNSIFGWDARSISGKHLDTVSDCEILCLREGTWLGKVTPPCHK